jgi:sensor histidine kinase YesM
LHTPILVNLLAASPYHHFTTNDSNLPSSASELEYLKALERQKIRELEREKEKSRKSEQERDRMREAHAQVQIAAALEELYGKEFDRFVEVEDSDGY